MPYSTNHLLITGSGQMFGGDIWSCGVRTGPPGGSTDNSALQTLVDTLAGRWATMFSTLGLYIASATNLEVVQVRYVSAAGQTLQAVENRPRPAVKGNGTASLPPQCSLVASLLTNVPGRRFNGRIYLPLSCSLMTSETGRVAPAAATQIGGAIADMLNGINTDLAAAAQDTSVSIQSTRSVGADFVFRVTSVRVGDVIDTQRRRRSALRESYTSSAVA
uniref:Uncharacterized protein n=1 Tax=uncultured prokaryote TaxID=198431 RepID=A0A0H5QN87_9ZZZZ|nr:hypothetical protein [uncultured prokaryote]